MAAERQRSPRRRFQPWDHDDDADVMDVANIEHVLDRVIARQKFTLSSQARLLLLEELRKFKGNVDKHIKTVNRVKKLEEEIGQVRSGSLPTGTPRMRLQYECPELDTEVGEEVVMRVVVQPHDTFRQAKQKLFDEHVAMQKTIDKLCNQSRKDSLRPSITLDSLQTRCRGILPATETTDTDLGELELDLPSHLFESIDLTRFVDDLYRDLILNIKANIAREQQKKEKEKIARQKVLDEAASLSQKDIIANVVRQVMEESKTKGKGKGKGKNKRNLKKAAPKYEVDYVDAMGISFRQEDLAMNASVVRPAKTKQRKRTKSQLSKWKEEKGWFSKNRYAPSMTGGKGKPQWGKGNGKAGTKGKGKGKSKGSKSKQFQQKGKGKGMPGKGNGWQPKGKGKGKGKNRWW